MRKVTERITTVEDGPQTVNERLTTGGPGPEGQADTVRESLTTPDGAVSVEVPDKPAAPEKPRKAPAKKAT